MSPLLVALIYTAPGAISALLAIRLAYRARRLDTTTVHGVWSALDAARRAQRLAVLTYLLVFLAFAIRPFHPIGLLAVLYFGACALRSAGKTAAVKRVGVDLDRLCAEQGWTRYREVVA